MTGSWQSGTNLYRLLYAVGYSGPTHISIRSGKQASSTANTHTYDFESVLSVSAFKPLMMTESNTVKPVIIIFVDGGPDKNLRYRKVKNFAIQHFKKYNLDALFIASNAPGRSAFNRVERRITSLSKHLSGVILPNEHFGVILSNEHFGSHLDDKGMTVDEDLEKRNFQHAEESLSKVCSEMKIDSYDVSAEYRKPELEDLAESNLAWYSAHVRESQYLLQVMKCADESCCSRSKSALKSVFPDTFLPLPLQSDLKNRICATCGIYFTSQKSVQTHSRYCPKPL
ncbi:hypothetical protein RN001_011264 [Aquatica leii]|uniref:Uncharacterized protein n=1 Tax=Aquatica leii TaxID=1421715 RepID=A0AAN7SNN6_9COLE|nr:hypothetical protein RN001_011264 [Aquatica leii]